MEGLEVQEPPSYSPEDPEDFCSSVLSQFSNSTEEHHRHLCAVIGAMSQELKDQNLPLTPIAYFGATCSSLDRLATETEPPSHALDALLTLLSMLIPRISSALLKKRTEFLSDLVVRILHLKSVTPGAAASGLKCVSHLLVIGHKSSWSDVSSLYGALLGYIADDRPKVRFDTHFFILP